MNLRTIIQFYRFFYTLYTLFIRVIIRITNYNVQSKRQCPYYEKVTWCVPVSSIKCLQPFLSVKLLKRLHVIFNRFSHLQSVIVIYKCPWVTLQCHLSNTDQGTLRNQRFTQIIFCICHKFIFCSEENITKHFIMKQRLD